MASEDCVLGAKHEAEIGELRRQAEENREDHDSMWDAINAIRNRLPLWGTVLISLLASTVTGLLVAIVKLRD